MRCTGDEEEHYGSNHCGLEALVAGVGMQAQLVLVHLRGGHIEATYGLAEPCGADSRRDAGNRP